MNPTDPNQLPDNLRPIAKLLFEGHGGEIHMLRGFLFLYLIILVLAIITFKLGFAKQLPPLKALVVYIFLAVGTFVLTFFGLFYPVTESLFFAALVLAVYRIRLHRERKERSATNK